MNPKAKGNRFERKIYKILRDSGLKVKRTLGSGSSDEKGDLIIEVGDAIIYAELKHWKKIPHKKLISFLKKLEEKLEKGEKGVLIFRENYKPILVLEREGKSLKLSLLTDWIERLKKY